MAMNVLLFINPSLIILGIVVIIAAIIGWYLLKFAIWILLIIVITGLLLIGLDLLIGLFSQFL
ncbi:MAG: hypothetical protein R6V50_04145 [Thermoplasmatota archaeon]